MTMRPVLTPGGGPTGQGAPEQDEIDVQAQVMRLNLAVLAALRGYGKAALPVIAKAREYQRALGPVRQAHQAVEAAAEEAGRLSGQLPRELRDLCDVDLTRTNEEGVVKDFIGRVEELGRRYAGRSN